MTPLEEPAGVVMKEQWRRLHTLWGKNRHVGSCFDSGTMSWKSGNLKRLGENWILRIGYADGAGLVVAAGGDTLLVWVNCRDLYKLSLTSYYIYSES